MEPYSILLGPLIDRGVVKMVLDSGLPETLQLLRHENVQHVHVTGAESTAKAIRQTLDEAGKTSATLTSELGCATPFALFPGEYSENELKNSASMIAAAKKSNAGANCLAAQVVVIPDNWDQKDKFRSLLKNELARQPTFPIWYPGSLEKKKKFMEKYPSHELIDSENRCADATCEDDVVLIDCGSYPSDDFDNFVTCNEAFSPILAQVLLKESSKQKYQDTLVEFLNSSEICGSLSCTLLVPATAPPDVIDDVLNRLRFGSVCKNIWSVFAYAACGQGSLWGAHPRGDGRSGVGFVGNNLCVDGAENAIVDGGGLEKLGIDMSARVPTLLLDVIYFGVVRRSLFGVLRLIVSAGLQGVRKLVRIN